MKIGNSVAFAGLLCFALLWTVPARANWRRAESPNFILFGNLPESELRQRILRLEGFDNLLRMETGVTEAPAPNKLHVYIVGNERELRTIRPVGPGVAGFYTATPDGIAAFVDNSAESTGNQILFHEYAHHFMMQYRPNAYPAWYVEGFAEYFMTAHFEGRSIDIGLADPGNAYVITLGGWLPMDRLLYGEPQSSSRSEMEQYYAQSWLTTHYFFSTPERQAALARYLLAVGGDNPRDALRTATGMDAAAFLQEIRRYAGTRIGYHRLTWREAATLPPVVVTAMPDAAGDLMIYDAALRVGINDDLGPDYLARIRDAAAHHQGDPFVQRVLARAELLYGDAAAADRLLDGLLATSPNDAELLYLKGLRYQVAADREGGSEGDARTARRWFGRAHQADEHHYQTLFRYAQSLRSESDHDSENTLNVLMLAHRLAPQVSSITLEAAAMLMGRRDFAHAIPLLRPLAADPHKTDLARAARQMIEQAQAGGAGQPAPAQEPAARERPD